MDRRDAMSLPGPSSYFMQRGLSGSGGSTGFQSLSNLNLQFDSNIGSKIIGPALPVEQSSTFSQFDANNINVASALPPSESVKRKRGRPRKYGQEGPSSSALTPSISSLPTIMTSPSKKRGRGRPLGTGKKQQLDSVGDWVSGSAGMGFYPACPYHCSRRRHLNENNDVFAAGTKSCLCHVSQWFCFHCDSSPAFNFWGAQSLMRGASRYCLSGSYMLTNNPGSHHRSGGLSASLASPDGRVIGGGVGGVLIAATPIQEWFSFSFRCPKTMLVEMVDGGTLHPTR